MSNPILGISLVGAFALAAATVGVDQLIYKPQARHLAEALAAHSMVEGAPDGQDKLAADLFAYRGRSQFLLMEHMQNKATFQTASDFGMTFWRLQNPEHKATVDLGTSRGRRIFDVTRDFLSAKIVNTSAVIDNRDPERGPVFIHDGLSQSQLDVTMDALKEEYGSAANLPQELIVVSYHKGSVGIFVDEDGEELKKSPYAPYINESPWNPKLAEHGVIEKGQGLIEKGIDLFNRLPK